MINFEVFQKEKISATVLVFILFSISYFFYSPSSKYEKQDLLVDVNKADFKRLVEIPYIGEKTAKKIIKIREEKGYFKSINELKNFRNFKKFKYYIKVEKNAP
jgi:competence protein ComEA